MTDTIFAPATAPGRAAVAVVRLSGPATGEALKSLSGKLPFPRRASVRRLKDAAGAVFDEALVLWMPGSANYTGEDSAELQLHGGPAVVEAAIEALAALGLRLAEPGEFTRRAFQNGRLDLAQAEAVADLVDAETASQARQALAQLEGGLSRRYDSWRDILVEALAVLEAAVDFPDEDLPEDVAARARPGLTKLLEDLDAALAGADRGRKVREGYRIALVGAPNAGKSSLLNALAARDAAIVTEIPGTTRDIIEVPLVLAGYKVLLADTAGVRATADPIEQEGVRRARAWAEAADLRLILVDGAGGGDWEDPAGLGRPGDLLVRTKADLGPSPLTGPLKNHARAGGLQQLAISVTDGQGLEALEKLIEQRVISALSGADLPAATRLRHAESLTTARLYLDRALAQTEVELAAEDVRLAARALGRVTGRVDVEDVLDRVFASFCIGK
ncbi:tRNA modification GTPase [Caulobacter ginsengisoli]|uniref:tRNA modification GTPase MnmE n=1 Tax=Caulobacter ginsengisoli TaxID=400775 RepID=A0ABU0ITH3_9CAUL|nr:tRNA uridine-5-carboxymethylaminomethyl(34) synthesis GTPase MnmE [Caulobacter ginsengisoli]MDQ0465307.1 tRNA modification GTPase [Caulobacter ginsengisoli]